MAYVNNSTDAAIGRNEAGTVRRFFARIGEMLELYAEARSKHEQVTFLYSLSDDQLAQRGLTRDSIPQAVFKGQFGL